MLLLCIFFFFASRRRHTRLVSDWSSDVCSSDLDRHVRRRTHDGAIMGTTAYVPVAVRKAPADEQVRADERFTPPPDSALRVRIDRERALSRRRLGVPTRCRGSGMPPSFAHAPHALRACSARGARGMAYGAPGMLGWTS